MPAAVTLYIVHHPELNTTSQIARELHLWFRLGDSIGNQSDAGLPVWYRREVRAAADKPGGIDFHPEIRFEDSRLNVVVLLVDQHFVASVDWCNAAERLVQQYEQEKSRLLILPVALHDSFYRLSTVYEKHNPIRLLDEPDPRRSSIALRRLVSECITRRLRQKSVADLPAKLEVFLSHAKADGRKVAEMIRDSLSQFGQLEAWYDANELAFGQNWKEKICKAAGKNTAAMISIVTDTYASRPWCRTEVEVARTPQPVGNSRRIWKLQPAVAVHVTGSSWSRTMQGVAGMPRIGWNIANPSASVAAIVDRLMLETMLSHSHRHTAHQLERKMAKGSTPEKLQDTLFITWTPCHYTLSKLRESVNQEQNDRSSEIQTIVFPGNDLRAAEASDLQPILKTFGTNTRLLSFEDAFRTLDAQELTNENQLPPKPRKRKKSKKLRKSPNVAVSGIGLDSELQPHGIGSDHLEELLTKLSIALLQNDTRIVFGGTLAKITGTSTTSLLDLGLTWLPEKTVDTIKMSDPATWPFQNYLQWPDAEELTVEHRARQARICNLIPVLPAGLPPRAILQQMDSGTKLRYGADSTRELRRITTEKTNMRVIFGGLLESTRGWMPGALEELGLSIKACKPVIILGGFGGAAADIATYLKSASAPLPRSLQYSQDWILRKCPELPPSTLGSIAAFHEDMLKELETLRDLLHDASDDRTKIFGIPKIILIRALTEHNMRRAVGLVVEALQYLP